MQNIKKRAQKLQKLKLLVELEKKQISEKASEKRLRIKHLDDLIDEAFKAPHTPANQSCFDFVRLAEQKKQDLSSELNKLLEEVVRCHKEEKKFEKLSIKVSEKLKTLNKKNESKFLDGLILLRAAWQKIN